MKLSAALLSDLHGGLVAAAVVLPQATAFGVTVFAPWIGTAPGALTGLIGAIVLLLITGTIGGTIGLISGPTGPSMALLAGTTTVLVAAGVAPTAIVPALFAVTVLAGSIQLLVALAGGGRLMKFVPYPVVAGLTTGTGLLLIESQYKPLLGIGHDELSAQWHWLPVLIAVTAFFIARYVPRLMPRIPGSIAGLSPVCPPCRNTG